MSSFKEQYNRFERTAQSSRVMEKHPDRVPVIVERKDKTNLPELDKSKYLVPKNITIGQFMFILRTRIKVNKDQAIFVFVDNKLPAVSELISTVYDNHKDEDGFMYMTYAGESTFG